MATVPRHFSETATDIFKVVRRHPLQSILAPRSIAVIGASDRAGSVGHAILTNLMNFSGLVYAVNPHHKELLGRPCHATVAELPVVPDLVVIATPAPSVPVVVAQCVDAGVKGAVIMSAGFREVGEAGWELEKQVLAEARRGQMRLIGPNCLGFMLPHSGLNLTFAKSDVRPGRVAFLSQSGALGSAILDWSQQEQVGFSAFVSVGAMLDVGWGDLIDWFGDDPLTSSIILYMESVGDAREFLSAAREVALTKPVIVIKVGRTEAAAKAAASHTGAMVGSDAVLDAAFHRAGVLRVETISELFDMAEILAKQPLPAGPRLAIVTNAGGPGALAADTLETSGGQLATLSADTLAGLNQALPTQWSHGNPIDILGDAGPERFAQAIRLAEKEAGSDGTLVVMTPQMMTDPTAIAHALVSMERVTTKPLLASWMGGAQVEEGRRALNMAGIPTYDYPDTASRIFSLMWQHSRNLAALYETPAALPETPDAVARHEVAAGILHKACQAGNGTLSRMACGQLLEAYGIPVNEARFAASEEEAVTHARELGWPVVVKLFSESITHKSDVGGVKLHLSDEAAVRRAWQEIHAVVPGHDFQRVTVERMIQRSGVELIVGSTTDEQFGPVLLFGAGGKFVEVFQDHALGLPPLTTTLARRMIQRTRISAVLKGLRGLAPVNEAALEELLVRFSLLIIEQPRIKELEINPLLATAEGFLALDLRAKLHGSEVKDDALPKSAIRPYPERLVSSWKLRDGSDVTIRPIRPDDEPAMVRFHQTLSEDSVRLRYFTPLKLGDRVAHRRLSRICFIDYDREMALVVEKQGAGGSEILAVGRLTKLRGMNEAEFALLVSDHWQHQGIGQELLRRLVAFGRRENLACITADILTENHGMQNVARKVGFQVKTDYAMGECRAVMEL